MITMRRRLANFLKSQPKTEEMKEEVPAILLPSVQKEPEKKVVCSKCGKEFQRGLYMHEKHCKSNGKGA